MTIQRLYHIIPIMTLLFMLATMPLSAQRGRGQGGGMGHSQGMPQMSKSPEMGGQPGSQRGKPQSSEMPMKTTPAHPENKIGAELADHTALSAKLQKSLPPGTNLQEAAVGFKNMGQFVAAVNVSHNLDIPFHQLKTRVVDGKSLGDAIHELKPSMSPEAAKTAAQKAQKEADAEVRQSKGKVDVTIQQGGQKDESNGERREAE
jgi:hypothetical protein